MAQKEPKGPSFSPVLELFEFDGIVRGASDEGGGGGLLRGIGLDLFAGFCVPEDVKYS